MKWLLSLQKDSPVSSWTQNGEVPSGKCRIFFYLVILRRRSFFRLHHIFLNDLLDNHRCIYFLATSSSPQAVCSHRSIDFWLELHSIWILHRIFYMRPVNCSARHLPPSNSLPIFFGPTAWGWFPHSMHLVQQLFKTILLFTMKWEHDWIHVFYFQRFAYLVIFLSPLFFLVVNVLKGQWLFHGMLQIINNSQAIAVPLYLGSQNINNTRRGCPRKLASV